MNDFEYNKMLEQIRNERDKEQREELFKFIGDNGDDRFIEPLTQLLQTDDSPHMRSSLYQTFTKIGTELADEVIQQKIRNRPPKDDGKNITKKDWDAAVEFLSKTLEKSFITKVQEIIKNEGKLWGASNKGGVGIYIRNLLKNNGFNWGDTALRTYWSWVVEDTLIKLKQKE